MLKNLSLLLLSLVFATCLGAAQKPDQPGELPYKIHGTISNVDSNKKVLTVQTSGNQEQALPTNSDTTIRVDGKKEKFWDLKPGQIVTVSIDAARIVQVDATDLSSSAGHS